jgi:uncharacterized RDD family membrane protein YckC
MNADHSTIAPPSDVTLSFAGYGVEHPSLPTTAGFGIRAAARLIDMAVHWLIFIVSGSSFGVVLAIALRGNQVAVHNAVTQVRHTSLIAFVLGVVGGAMYFTVCETWHGSTVGKLVCGLVVLDENAQPCGFWSALGRSFAFFIDSLFFGIVGYMAMKDSPLHQRLGDQWCHTIVAKRSATPAATLRGMGRFATAASLAAVVDGACAYLGFFARLNNWG